MTASVFQCCYDITKAAVIAQAKDKAKEQGKSFSKYILDLIEEDTKKKNKQNLVPILSNVYQSSIEDYTPHLYNSSREKQKLWDHIDSCNNEDLTNLAIQLNQTSLKIKARRSQEFRNKKSKFHC